MSLRLLKRLRDLVFTAGLCFALGGNLGAASAAAPTSFECRWANSPPVIDGRLDDEAWQHAQVVDAFQMPWLPVGQRRATTATKSRLLWDREFLYFSAEMEDTDVFADVTEQDGKIWTCDVFELFFKPAIDRPGYYEFEVNAANGKLDMFIPEKLPGFYARHKSDRPFHIESAIQVRGTLNRRTDTDQGWTVEGKIPWRDFLSTGGRPVPGEVWQHALCRYDYSVGENNYALSTNANLKEPNFHLYDDYVPLRFIGPGGDVTLERIPWNDSRLIGSPEKPLAYRGVPAFPKLQIKQPVMIAAEPGRDSFLLLETNAYQPNREARVSRIANDPKVAQPELLLKLEESVYDICFHPKYAENGFLYIGGNRRFGPGRMEFNSHVVRYTMDRHSGRIDPASRVLIIEWHSSGHNGAALTFGLDGMLYVTTGDGTSDSDEWSSGQDMTRLLAKVLRLDVDRPAPGLQYGIPADNPFLTLPGARPETWAYGFRNPWRMTMDRVTGDIWVGENGQDLWEYARMVRRGENYGWPIVEGGHDFHPTRPRGPTPITKPLIEHAHTDFRSLTGGIVYRGTKFKDLVGGYVYGDFSTGQIWVARQRAGKLLEHYCIADTTLGIAAFAETPQGDILVVDHLGDAIRKLERAPSASTVAAFPAKLSETGLFRETKTLQPHPALIPYDVNVPGWHDGAKSERYIALPDTARVEMADQGGWKFPDGTAIAQTLSLGGKRIETRVLLRQQNEWAGYTYAWNDAQTDATLVPSEGQTRKLESGQTWRVPGKQECMSCHSRAANFVLGLSTVQLNRGTQIADWERAGLLTSRPAADDEAQWRREFEAQKLEGKALDAALALVKPSKEQRQPPKDSPLLTRRIDNLPRLVDSQDTRASLEDRARSYLHANCAHCHARNSGGNSRIQLSRQHSLDEMAVVNVDPLHSTFGLADMKIVTPGEPARSILLHRTVLRGPGQMPPIATTMPDGAGVNLLAQWIASLPIPTSDSKPSTP